MNIIKTYVDDLRASWAAHKWWYIVSGGLIVLALFVGLVL